MYIYLTLNNQNKLDQLDERIRQRPVTDILDRRRLVPVGRHISVIDARLVTVADTSSNHGFQRFNTHHPWLITRDQPSRLRIFDGRDYETSLTDICDRSLAYIVRNRFHEMIFKQLNWPFNFH